MLAVAVSRPPMLQAFFGCEINDKTYDRYFEGKSDLHYAFREALGAQYYFFDLAKLHDNVVTLEKSDLNEEEASPYWPQIGFFSRSHTSPFNRAKTVSSTKKFKIDGKWGANDFSHFHGKMSDLYALFGSISRLGGSEKGTERGFIREMIQERYWRGGGSYLGFYDSLFQRNTLARFTPLEVAK